MLVLNIQLACVLFHKASLDTRYLSREYEHCAKNAVRMLMGEKE